MSTREAIEEQRNKHINNDSTNPDLLTSENNKQKIIDILTLVSNYKYDIKPKLKGFEDNSNIINDIDEENKQAVDGDSNTKIARIIINIITIECNQITDKELGILDDEQTKLLFQILYMLCKDSIRDQINAFNGMTESKLLENLEITDIEIMAKICEISNKLSRYDKKLHYKLSEKLQDLCFNIYLQILSYNNTLTENSVFFLEDSLNGTINL